MTDTTIDLDDLTEEEQLELDQYVASRRDKKLGLTMLITGSISLIASFVLFLERIQLFLDPNYIPTCSINPVLSCGSVMVTEQARVFGFPNPVIGVALFPLVMAIGAALLAGVKFPRWWWMATQVGVVFGMGFIFWLITQSLYHINALCPYCMVVWVAMVPLFYYVSVRNMAAGVFSRSLAKTPLVNVASSYGLLAICAVYLTVFIMILTRFWDYWSTLL